MLGITNIICNIREYDYEIVNDIKVMLSNGKKHIIKYSSDYFVGYSFSDINNIFKLFNDLLEKISVFAIDSPIVFLDNEQHFLVNKTMQSTLRFYLENGKTYELDISTLFKNYVKYVDLYVRANDMVLNIVELIRRTFHYEKNKLSL